MAAELGISPEILDTEASHPDKRPEKLRTSNELLEQLRSRCGQHRSWSDSIKAVKSNLMSDKRHYDTVERLNIQTCLDKLHRAMKISSQQSLIERLELICRQLGMVFTPPTPPENNILLSAEMFKVVIALDGQNGIRDVRVGHQDSPSTCEDLVEVLRKGDFDEFVTHIQGLLSIYNISGDKKLKTKGYLALSSLESDLNLLAQLQSSINGVAKYIHKSPLGILLPRRGGHPMKLIYFVSPYNLLCKKTRMSYAMTVEAIAENDVGHSVTVAIEPCATLNKLQTMPLMSVKQNTEGKSLPSFQAVNSMNSFSLPASFVLVLPQPVPIAKSIISAIQEITGLDVGAGKEQSLLSLLLQQFTEGQVSSAKELFVTLPDQQHAYFLNNPGNGCLGQGAALVTRIPFTQPTCVPNILNLLRQQLMFNSVMQSLIRPSAKKDYKSSLIFEVTALTLQYISVMFEHPLQDSMVTAEFDLSDITSVKCSIFMNNKDDNLCSDEFVSRAFQRCFSIPVTLRTVIHKVDEQIMKLVPPEPVSRLVVRTRLKWKQRTSVKTSSSSVLNTNSVQPNMLTALPNQIAYTSVGENLAQGSHTDMRKFNLTPALNRTFLEPPPISEEEKSGGGHNLLASLLETGPSHAEATHVQNIASESPMLSKLLEENTSVTTNLPPPNSKKRLTKRKSSKDMIAGKSPKIRLSESDMTDKTSGSMLDRMTGQPFGQGIAEKHIDLDSSGGSYDEPVRPASVSSVGSVGGHSSTGSIIDLTDSSGIGESHVKKLENSLDSIMQKESRAGTLNMNTSVNVNSQMAGDMMDMRDFHPGLNPNQMLDSIGDFAHPQQWGPRQTPPHPLARNSPHHGLQKNEKISTSLEELLLGPGGREMEGPNTLHGRKNSTQRRQNLKRQNSLGRNSLDSSTGVVSPDVFSPVLTSPGHHPLSSPSQLPISSPIQVISPGGYAMTSQGSLVSSSPGLMPGSLVKSEILSMSDSKGSSTGSQTHFTANLVRGNVMNSMHHGSSGKPSLSALKAQLEMKNDVNLSGGTLTQEKDIKAEDHFGNNTQSFPPMKLKLNMKLYDTVSPPGSDENKSRSSTFDFHSDDEDFTLPVVDKITIVSSSPTRLQISNKPTLASFNNFNKTEKFKRKEREKQMKRVSSLDSGKRKREKEESKKERKKKRLTNSEYSIDKDMGVYQSTTVDVEGGSDNYKPITKLKITKSGGKMSIENSGVLKVTEVKPEKSEKPRIEKVDKEAVLKIEKVDKINRKEEKEMLSDFKDVKPEVKNSSDPVEKDKTIDKALLARSLAPSNEGIFDKINAMKSESVSKGENVTSKEKTGSVENAKKSTSSKSQKTHKASSKVTSSSKSSSDSSSKVTKTPTIKLKPISVPSNSSSTSSTLQNSPSTPSTPKSVTQSPTSTTIGKIGAVSLATSGSHKSLSGNNNNNSKLSQQTGSNKIVNSTTKSLSTSQSTSSSTKSSSSAVSQKHLSGSSGKNSPVLQQSKSVQHSRSLSNPNSSTSKSEKGLSKSVSSTTIRTSSPLSDKERNKSSSGLSRNSGSNNRDREKSTSSKNTVPVTTVITQETAASVLSFLNPKANKISSLPPIPKLSSASSGTPKVSTPTSAVSVTVTSSSASVSNSSNVSSSKYGKGNNSSSSSKTTNSFAGNKSTNSPNLPGNKGANVQNSFNNKVGSGGNYSNSSNNRAQNPALTGSIKKTGSNSPTNFSQKNSSSQYNKVVNSNNTQNTNFGYRNNHSSNSANAMRTTGQANSSNQVQSKTNKPSSSISGNKGGNSSFSNRGSGSSPLSRGSFSANSTSSSVSRPNTTVNTSSSVTSVNSVKGSVMGPNAPRGPGPPSQVQQITSVSVNNMSDSQKAKTSSSSSHSSISRNRKGSLSAVIDKLTCKASMPLSSDSSVSAISQTSKCIIEESPASPEPEPANTANDTGQAKEERKVVIFDAPASPEPEQASIVVKKTGSSDSIVSIPLEERRESTEKQSNVNGDHRSGDKSVFAKPSNSLSNSPKVIPLNSHTEKSSLSHTTSVSTTKSSINRHNSVSNSAIYSQQNGDIGEGESEIIKCDLSASSKSISGPDKAKDSPFKVPTPKSTEDSSRNQEDLDDKLKKRTVRTTSFSKSISNSPSSPVSSPENGLVIDFSSSPKNAVNRTNSPQCPNVDSENRPAAVKAIRSSLGLTSNLKTSPGSPLDEDNLSAEGDSPFLDDDLMDAALGL